MTPEQTAATGCLAFAVVLAATWWRGQRRATPGARLFTREQRAQLGEVYTANCIFRPCHWLPLGPLLVGLAAGWPRAALEVLALLTGIGTPPALRAHRCAGPMQGGHQRAHSRGGTTSLWNGVPECRRHNLEHRAGSTFAYACTLGPISLIPYLVRVATGGVRLLLRKDPA